MFFNPKSISPKKLQTQNLSTKKLHNTLLYEKAVHQMLLKLTSCGSTNHAGFRENSLSIAFLAILILTVSECPNIN